MQFDPEILRDEDIFSGREDFSTQFDCGKLRASLLTGNDAKLWNSASSSGMPKPWGRSMGPANFMPKLNP